MTRLGPWIRTLAAVERTGMRTLLGAGPVRRWLAASRSAAVEGRTLDPEIAAMLRLDDIAGHSDLRGLEPAAARRRVARDILVADAAAPPGVVHHDRAISGPAGPIPVRLYEPEHLAGPSPGIVYLHGGGWVTGDIETHDGLCRRLALGAECRVVSVEYRLAPEHRFPAAADDAVAAFYWVIENATELNIDPAVLAVAGDSAGGNLSAVVARRATAARHPPALQVLLYPGLDATCSLPSHTTFAEGYFLTGPMVSWYYDHYLGGQDARHPDASPLLAPDLPPVPAIVVTAGFDPLRDEGLAYAERLRRANVPVLYEEMPALPHGFALMTGAAAAAAAATQAVIAEVRSELAR